MNKKNELMMKSIKKSLPLMLLALVLLLSACGKKPVFGVSTNEDNSIRVAADRGSKGSTGIGYLTIGKNEQVIVDATDMGKDGKLSLCFVAGVLGSDDFSEEPAYEMTVSGGDSASFTAEPGEYTVGVTAQSKVTGTALIRTETAAEAGADSVSDETAPEESVEQDSDATVSESQEEEALREIVQGTDGGFTYADLTGMEFYFSSGAGGWATVMTIDADGTFSGNFHDSDMGDTGGQYPNGTLYYCDFKGSLGELTRIDKYTYRTELKSIDFVNVPDTEEYKDDIRYIYSTAYGLDDAKDLYFYLPGKPASELPEPFISWVPMASETAENGNITIYGLYNEKAETGFGGYPAYEDTEDTDPDDDDETSPEDASSEQIREHVEEVQKQADELEYRLEHEDLSQTEMNQTAAELYTLWDDEINAVWQYLKGKLPENEMKKLTDEERAWISDKEAQIQKEGEQYEGGSIRPMAENRLGAKLTRERVYELLEYV